jgi:hypothetical protein
MAHENVMEAFFSIEKCTTLHIDEMKKTNAKEESTSSINKYQLNKLCYITLNLNVIVLWFSRMATSSIWNYLDF